MTGARDLLDGYFDDQKCSFHFDRHKHEAPLFGWVMEGEITVDYGDAGKKTYKKGDAFIEALESYHNGKNTGDTVTRILAVFSGADGVPNTVMEAE